MNPLEPDEQRAASREAWDVSAAGWSRAADVLQEHAMPVSRAMIDALDLQPGQSVLELAAGPGDTGFMAAELIRPGGTLISSDGSEAMVEVARARAHAQGVDNVEFRQLELEWIDLPTASVDAVLCRWGIMLIVDPDAAAREIRRVLRPGGRASLAVWDEPVRNPWATITDAAMVELGHTPPPEPGAPSMFGLAGEGRLAGLLEEAGFTEVEVIPVEFERRYASIDDYTAETAELSRSFRKFRELDAPQQSEVVARISAQAQRYSADDGSLALPAVCLVAVAGA